jgi:hypothetical protein
MKHSVLGAEPVSTKYPFSRRTESLTKILSLMEANTKESELKDYSESVGHVKSVVYPFPRYDRAKSHEEFHAVWI